MLIRMKKQDSWKVVLVQGNLLTHRTNHHCLRSWLAAWSAPSHHLNQWWTIVDWNIRTNFSKLLSKHHAFSHKNMHLKMSAVEWRPFCRGSNVSRENDHSSNKSQIDYPEIKRGSWPATSNRSKTRLSSKYIGHPSWSYPTVCGLNHNLIFFTLCEGNLPVNGALINVQW